MKPVHKSLFLSKAKLALCWGYYSTFVFESAACGVRARNSFVTQDKALPSVERRRLLRSISGSEEGRTGGRRRFRRTEPCEVTLNSGDQ
jgi:hypothetical protein